MSKSTDRQETELALSDRMELGDVSYARKTERSREELGNRPVSGEAWRDSCRGLEEAGANRQFKAAL